MTFHQVFFAPGDSYAVTNSPFNINKKVIVKTVANGQQTFISMPTIIDDKTPHTHHDYKVFDEWRRVGRPVGTYVTPLFKPLIPMNFMDFMNSFTSDEQKGLMTDHKASMFLMSISQGVNFRDPKHVAGINNLANSGLVSSNTVAALLANNAGM